MRIYHANGGERVIVSFGSGLVGTAVREELLLRGAELRVEIPVQWGATQDVFEQDWINVSKMIHRSRPIQVVWAAGGAGFAAPAEQAQREVDDFRRWVARLHDWGPVEAYLVSSAGGLYEGTHLVTANSPLTPMRPYGEAKRDTEKALETLVPTRAIYRPSSIYGPVRKGYRLGLIATMIRNALLGGVTRISGTASTLRDYVFAGDIGYHVARDVFAQAALHTPLPAILASGKPSAIFEVREALERLLRRRTYITFDPAPGNARDIVFSHGAIAPNFESRDLRTGIRLAVLLSQR